jgi:type IV pilus assembly protein PilC
MPKYRYSAVKPSGETYQGIVEGKDRFEVYSIVRKDGGNVLSVTEAGAGWSMKLGALLSIFSRVKEAERIMLIRNLSAMLKAGLALSRALNVMERQTKNPKLKTILGGVQADIQKGDELSAAIKKFPETFPPLVSSMIKAGEESGTLSESLNTIAEQMDRSYQLKKKIRGALIYPAIIIFALIIVGVLMLVYIVPTLTETFEELGVELPATTQFIIGASRFLTENTVMALGASILSFATLGALLRTRRGKRAFDYAIIRIPVIGTIVQETNAARTGRTLASLLSSGVNVVNALDITQGVLQHSMYKDVIGEAKEVVQRGEPISKVIAAHEGLYPPLVSELTAVGEETGKLPEMFAEIAKFYENEVEQKTKNISTIIEPFLMLIVGGAVGFFAVSMITPIYSISSSI